MDYLVENNPELLAALEKAREEYLKLVGMGIDEYLKKKIVFDSLGGLA